MVKQVGVFALGAVLALSACFSPKSPQQVTQAFWQSVLANDVQDAVEYSTLLDAKQYDGFSRNWDGYQATWGRVVIDGDNANVETRFTKPGEDEASQRVFTTHLVRRKDQWIVDYARTKEELQGGVIGSLLGKLGEVGKEFSEQLEFAAKQLGKDLEHLANELEKQAESLEGQTTKDLEKFAEAFSESIIELRQSLKQALEEYHEQFSEQDRRMLQEVLVELDKDLQQLARPNIRILSEVSKNLAISLQRLETVSTPINTAYKRRWRALGEKVEDDMKFMIRAFSTGAQAL